MYAIMESGIFPYGSIPSLGRDFFMEKIKVSVIVPVYNAETHLEQCLSSILCQSLKEIEIICVDDGSDDRSPDILKQFQQQDNRIILLNQNHLYAGTARNYGKSIAKGEYLVFWDADDYFEKDALKEMYEQCVKDDADVCICSGRQYLEDCGYEVPASRYIRKKEIPETVPFNAESEPDHILSITVEAPWNKMFRRTFIEQMNLDFQPLRNANDVYFVISALSLAKRVTLVNQQLVTYRKNKTGGLVSTVHKNLNNAFQAWTDTAADLKKRNAFAARSFANRALESIIYLFCNVSDWESYQKGFMYLRENNVLDELNIFDDVPEDYYYVDYHAEAAGILRNGTPEQFAQFMWRVFYLKEGQAAGNLRREKEIRKAQVDRLKKEKKDLMESVSFKAGRVLTWLPRKIKNKL